MNSSLLTTLGHTQTSPIAICCVYMSCDYIVASYVYDITSYLGTKKVDGYDSS